MSQYSSQPVQQNIYQSNVQPQPVQPIEMQQPNDVVLRLGKDNRPNIGLCAVSLFGICVYYSLVGYNDGSALVVLLLMCIAPFVIVDAFIMTVVFLTYPTRNKVWFSPTHNSILLLPFEGKNFNTLCSLYYILTAAGYLVMPMLYIATCIFQFVEVQELSIIVYCFIAGASCCTAFFAFMHHRYISLVNKHYDEWIQLGKPVIDPKGIPSPIFGQSTTLEQLSELQQRQYTTNGIHGTYQSQIDVENPPQQLVQPAQPPMQFYQRQQQQVQLIQPIQSVQTIQQQSILQPIQPAQPQYQKQYPIQQQPIQQYPIQNNTSVNSNYGGYGQPRY